MWVDVKWKFTSILYLHWVKRAVTWKTPFKSVEVYASCMSPCVVIVDCVYADWYIILRYALKYANIAAVYFLKSWNPVELQACVATVCWRSTWRPISVFRILRLIYCILILRLIYYSWLIYFVYWRSLCMLTWSLHCIHLGRDCRPARLLFFSISLCHIKFIIVNYTNNCKYAIFGI